jgi:hypothetical protein
MSARTTASAAELYRQIILGQVPRVLGLVDREPLSPTAGCGDRTYWAWKFVDFPRARFQEALCVMSFLYATDCEGNSCFHHPRLIEWIALGMRFWTRMQRRDGSFDEAYPFERSLAATAFTTFYVGEALAFVKADLPADVTDALTQAMTRAGDWLVANDETHGFLSNHLAAAAAALVHVHRVTGSDRFERRSREFITRILEHQSTEGWYDEYGGADPGYQTHGSFYLARICQLTTSGGDELIASVRRSMAFLAHFVHADGSLGGEYASRNTQTYYPAAFEMFAGGDATAAWIAETMRPSVATGNAAGLAGIDAYNYFPFLNNLVFAYLASVSGTPVAPSEPSSGDGLVWFPDAGLARVRTPRYDAYVGTAKGGVVKVFDRRRRMLVYSDCGYVGLLTDGTSTSSQYLDRQRKIRVEPTSIEVEGDFVQFSRPTLNPFLFVAFRVFTLTIGRLPSLARWLKMRLVTTLVYRQRPVHVHLTRRIEFDDHRVTVRDRLEGPDLARLRDLRWGAAFTTIHMGSSRYFVNNELAAVPPGERIDTATLRSGREIERHVLVADAPADVPCPAGEQL